MKVFSENLKYYRKKAGLSQTKLAGLAGVKPNTISNYENNTSTPDLDMFVKIVKILDVNPLYLLEEGTYDDYLTEKETIKEPELKYEVACQQCELRERLIRSMEITISVLNARCNDFEHNNNCELDHKKATEST